jgi:hypothetical protein
LIHRWSGREAAACVFSVSCPVLCGPSEVYNMDWSIVVYECDLHIGLPQRTLGEVISLCESIVSYSVWAPRQSIFVIASCSVLAIRLRILLVIRVLFGPPDYISCYCLVFCVGPQTPILVSVSCSVFASSLGPQTVSLVECHMYMTDTVAHEHLYVFTVSRVRCTPHCVVNSQHVEDCCTTVLSYVTIWRFVIH